MATSKEYKNNLMRNALYGELGQIPNPKGGTSTEYSITENIPELGGWVNIPTMVEGQVNVQGLLSGEKLTPEQFKIAVRRAITRKKQGAELPAYKTLKEALKKAESRTPQEKYAPYKNDNIMTQAQGASLGVLGIKADNLFNYAGK